MQEKEEVRHGLLPASVCQVWGEGSEGGGGGNLTGCPLQPRMLDEPPDLIAPGFPPPPQDQWGSLTLFIWSSVTSAVSHSTFRSFTSIVTAVSPDDSSTITTA